MKFTRNLKICGALLIATACCLTSGAPGATLPSQTAAKGLRVKSKMKSVKLTNQIRRPRISGLSSPSSKPVTLGSTANHPKTKRKPTPPGILQSASLTPTKTSKIKKANVRRLNSDAPSTSTPKVKRKSKALKPTTSAPNSDLSFSRSGQSENLARRAGRAGDNMLEQARNLNPNETRAFKNKIEGIHANVAEQAQGINSSSMRAIEEAMPGFSTRGAHGATGLRGMGIVGGRNRNPVTTSGDQGDFSGGDTGHYSDGGASITNYSNGSTRVVNDAGNGKPPSVTIIVPGTGQKHTDSDGKTVFSFENGESRSFDKDGNEIVAPAPAAPKSNDGQRQVISIDDPGYYTNGNPVEPVTMGAPTVTSGGKQGSKKEPTPSDNGDGTHSGYLTGADLRGLAARFTSRIESTGEEGTTGGPVDGSRTRAGRIGQVGQPTADGPATPVMPTAAEVSQVMRIRLQNITPIPR